MPVVATPTAVQTGGCTDQPYLPGANNPNPLPVSCRNQRIIVPRTPTEPSTGTPILTRTFAIEIKGQQAATIDYVMRDRQGIPVNLQECLCAGSDSSLSISQSAISESGSSESESCGCDYRMVFRLCEYLSGGHGQQFPVSLVNNGQAGEVRVNLTPKDTHRPGVYFGEFAMIECKNPLEDPVTDDTIVVFSNKIYVIIGRNLWNNRMNGMAPAGPPSISEIRMHLRDTDPSESYLLDNVAFSDEEIAQCIYMPVQYWNEIPPPIGIHNTNTFPYRYHWLMAIAGYLFLMVAEQQRRNNLTYSAGGVQVNDQNREPNYEKAAQTRLQEFKDFVTRKKSEINLENAYGFVGSQYVGANRRMGY